MKEVQVKITTSQKGPMEGMVIVNGRPQMEPADMPVIHIKTVEDIEKLAAIMKAVKSNNSNPD